MRIILQAIKSLFRKIENTIGEHSNRISTSQTTADNALAFAKEAAKNAQMCIAEEVAAREAADAAKMNSENPVGTGSFGMNRSTNYTAGNNSVSTGIDGVSVGECSFTHGRGLRVGHDDQCAVGKYNIVDAVFRAESALSQTSPYTKSQKAYRSNTYTFDSITGKYTLNSPLRVGVTVATIPGNYFFSDEKTSDVIWQLATSTHGDYYIGTKLYAERLPCIYLSVVGNGTSDTDRSNAYTLDWKGVPWYQGRPQFGGNAQDDGAQSVMANGDTEIILASSTADSTKQFRITVDDSGVLTATEVTT